MNCRDAHFNALKAGISNESSRFLPFVNLYLSLMEQLSLSIVLILKLVLSFYKFENNFVCAAVILAR